MPEPPRRLKQLEKELLMLGEGTMLIEELDGFVAGVLVCPELIAPAEWLPAVWGGDDKSRRAFDDLNHANRVLRLVMQHYNSVARVLMEGGTRYRPLFPVDERNGDIIWEIWIEGFAKAVELRPAAWQSAEAGAAAAMRGLRALIDVTESGRRAAPSDHEVTAAAPANIAPWIVALHAWRLTNGRPMQGATAPFATVRKTGRNDLCPCGSSKKYKRCCGLH